MIDSTMNLPPWRDETSTQPLPFHLSKRDLYQTNLRD